MKNAIFVTKWPKLLHIQKKFMLVIFVLPHGLIIQQEDKCD